MFFYPEPVAGRCESQHVDHRVGGLKTNRMNSVVFSSRATVVSGLVLTPCALAAPASARPETIRAGVSYDSDGLIESGPVWDIGAE